MSSESLCLPLFPFSIEPGARLPAPVILLSPPPSVLPYRQVRPCPGLDVGAGDLNSCSFKIRQDVYMKYPLFPNVFLSPCCKFFRLHLTAAMA